MIESLETIKTVVDSSSELTDLALSILAGSVATVVSTSYWRPTTLLTRMPYLLFIPGWACLGYSLYAGNLVSRKYIAMGMINNAIGSGAPREINSAYTDQLDYMFYSICLFGVWLFLYVLIWVFSSQLTKEK